MIRLPVRVALAPQLRLMRAGDADGGWTVVECYSVEQARRVMREYPDAALPCWRNPSAPWNQAAK